MTQPIDSQSNQPSLQQGKYDSMEAKPHYGPVGGKTDFDLHTCRWMWWRSRAWLRVRWGPTTTRDVRAGGTTVPPTTATATSLPEPTSSTGPDLPEEATDVSDPPEATGRSDLPGVSVGFTDEEGWTYSAPMWPPTGVHSWSLDISSSPPGKARVSIDWDKGDTPLNVDLPPNNPEGRVGPKCRSNVAAWYTKLTKV